MSKKTPGAGNADERTPSTRERLRPAELVGFAAVLAVFTGIVVLYSTRELLLSGIFFGVAFIVGLVFLALFALTIKPNKNEVDDIEEQDRGE